MLNRLSVKALWVVALILVVAVVFIVLNDKRKPTSTLPQLLISIDSTILDRVTIARGASEPYDLIKDQGQWKLRLENQKLVAIAEPSLLAAIKKMGKTKPKRVITRKEEKWKTYEVGDEKGIKVTLFGGGQELGAVVIGKFDFNQQTRSMSNYVRVANRDDVYLIEDPLSFDWNKEPSGWRNKNIVSMSKSDLSKLVISGDVNLLLLKEAGTWICTEGGMDSLEIDQFLDQFSNITSDKFADDVEIDQLASPSSIIELYSDQKNVTLSVFDFNGRALLSSSENPAVLFLMDQPLKEKLFPKGELEVEDAN